MSNHIWFQCLPNYIIFSGVLFWSLIVFLGFSSVFDWILSLIFSVSLFPGWYPLSSSYMFVCVFVHCFEVPNIRLLVSIHITPHVSIWNPLIIYGFFPSPLLPSYVFICVFVYCFEVPNIRLLVSIQITLPCVYLKSPDNLWSFYSSLLLKLPNCGL